MNASPYQHGEQSKTVVPECPYPIFQNPHPIEAIVFDNNDIAELQRTLSDALYTEIGSLEPPPCNGSKGANLDDTSRNEISKPVSIESNNEGEAQTSKLELLLRTYTDGKVIKRSYKHNNGYLTESTRKLLVHLIIQSELDKALATLSDDGTEKLQDFIISSEMLVSYATDIEKLFKTESSGTYFNPFKSINGVRVLAHGKLWEHYGYVKAVLREQGVLEIRRPRTKQTQHSPIVTDDVKLKLEWLKSHCEPWEEVLDTWRATHEARRNILTIENKAIFEYFGAILALRLQIGSKLLECDFNLLWPDKHSILFDTWGTIKHHLIFRLKSAKNIKNTEDKAYVHLLSTLPDSQQDSVIFMLLPYLIPSERAKSRKRKAAISEDASKENVPCNMAPDARKLSLNERRESFTLRVPTAADLHSAINKRKEYLRARGLSFQPTPVIVGTVTDIQASYVVIDDIIYNVDSYLHAIDLTFKIFYAVNCEYPDQCRSVWLFLQKGIYNIEAPTDKFPVAVNALAGEIRHLRS